MHAHPRSLFTRKFPLELILKSALESLSLISARLLPYYKFSISTLIADSYINPTENATPKYVKKMTTLEKQITLFGGFMYCCMTGTEALCHQINSFSPNALTGQAGSIESFKI